MTSFTSPYDSAPTDTWLNVFGSLPASSLVDNIEGIRDLVLSESEAAIPVTHYMGWLAGRLEPLLTDSRKESLAAFPATQKAYHLLLQLKSEGVDLSSITLSPFNSEVYIDSDEEEEATSPVECYGIEHAIQVADQNHNLAKIATRVLGYRSLATGTDAEKADHFRAWVSAHPGDCAAVTALNLKGLGLTVFPNELASCFPNLNWLYLSNNQLTSIDVSQLAQLRTLNLADNQLASIDVSELTQLHSLSLRGNKLTSIEVSELTQLQALNLENNHLTSLDVSQLTQLQALYLSGNQLTSVEVSELTQLQSLFLSGNHLTSLDVSQLTQLEWLSLTGNHLTSLDVSRLTQLKALYLSGNHLTSLEVSQLTQLEALFLNDNQLTLIDLSKLRQLRALSLKNNQLTSITFKTINQIFDLIDESRTEVKLFEIYLSMHEVNIAFEADVRADIIQRYNEIKASSYPDLRPTWSDDPLIQTQQLYFERSAFRKAVIQVLLEKSGGVIT